VRLSRICLCGLLTLVCEEAPLRSSGEVRPDRVSSIDRFLAQKDVPLASAVTRRHLVATTRGGAMSGWIDACTFLDGQELRYEIVAQGGSSAVGKRALIPALDGEVKARRDGDAARAALVPANYEFTTTADAPGDVLRVTLKPKRRDSMLIDGAMTLARDSGELLSIEGRLVKSPSFWAGQVHVTRRYARIAGVRVPIAMESRAKVLVVGPSTFDMSYRYLAINGEPVAGETGEASPGCGAAMTSSPSPSGRPRPEAPRAAAAIPTATAGRPRRGVERGTPRLSPR
jgi:hypothetical protein